MAHSFLQIVLSVLLIECVLAFPHFNSKHSNSSQESFWFVNDNGERVQAFLTGGPPAETLATVEDNVQFWLYRNGREPGVEIDPSCTDCLASFVSGAPLKIFVHGFTSNYISFGQAYRNAIAQKSEDINVIVVNWDKLAASPWYETAANNVDPVGAYTARLINSLVQKGLTSLDNIHMVGHSLGSHVGNFITNNVQGGKLGRITALDPALPLFGQRDDSRRIDPSDADFVDVIHTSMGVLPDGLAFTEPRGHVDFYPNSGKHQPGCGMDAFGSCSHGRANSYFAESISNTRAFVSCKCTDWKEYDEGRCLCLDQEVMGWAAPYSARGLFYLRTNANSPYGQG